MWGYARKGDGSVGMTVVHSKFCLFKYDVIFMTAVYNIYLWPIVDKNGNDVHKQILQFVRVMI